MDQWVKPSENDLRRLRACLQKEGEHWVWTGRDGGTTKALFLYQGKRWMVRRLLWFIYRGPYDGYIFPVCGVRLCMRPSHQRKGMNHQDALALLEAASNGVSTATLAERYKITPEMVRSIRGGRRFRRAFAEFHAEKPVA